MKNYCVIALLLLVNAGYSQSYTSYFTGNTNDAITTPDGGVCVMGGASEHDEAMKWFLQRANGGDILVLRTSGSDGYNNYMFSQLGITVNSVETIVFNNATASNDSYVQQKIANAEAIWFAGGDQWNYISYWRNTPVDSMINASLNNKNIAIGGTSAGMAILGGFYFSAQNGTVTSTTALSNPYVSTVTVDSTHFLEADYLSNVITDTHYDDPDRKGRHVAFLARIYTDYGIAAKGIACNEYTAVCIDENGLARVFGDWPNYPETAFFLQTNCELEVNTPETCQPGSSLDWNLNGTAIRVYAVNGTNNGANTFDLSDWETGNGGAWENWYVDNGTLNQTSGSQIDCGNVAVNELSQNDAVKVFPNPSANKFHLEADEKITAFKLLDLTGKVVAAQSKINDSTATIDASELPAGVYFLTIQTKNGTAIKQLLKQ